MTAPFKAYLKTISDARKAGTATEHTYRPAFKTLLESIDTQIVATNEPKQIACGAPDYIITRDSFTVGYIEAKDIGKSLDNVERSDQMKRYLRALDNLILTDYLEFRWYVDGELRQEGRLARVQADGKLKNVKGGAEKVTALLQNFLAHQPEAVSNPKELAERMARLTHIIRDIILTAFETGQESNLLQGWRDAFAQVLIADLGQPERTADFADMVAQTLAYGLFSARLMDTTPDTFSRHEAQKLIPKSNPFLRRFFARMTGIELDDEPFAPFVNDLVNLLAHTDMAAVLADFGKRTRQEDPIVHFYETFLAAYDPKLREARGVYYTPAPVVSYIVRSVDHLLKSHFNCPQGLADSSKVTIPNYDPSLMVKGKRQPRKTIESHKVLVLDPATGTGTFLYAVIDLIRAQFMAQGNAGMWPGYVKHHLLPRLFGFELLMAPYAVAHFKLSLQLAGRDLHEAVADQWAYVPDDTERLGVYLTNALEEAHEMTGLPLFTQWVADETNAANEVKHHLPVLVVMGNPPYSANSANKGDWITSLIQNDYYPNDHIKEQNPKLLLDDYVKFIRWGQWRIEQSGQGILAFISNNGYLDNPTFRNMRQKILDTFTDVFIFNLHGDTRKKEVSPDGSKDENVFDIQQGVAIGIFVKDPKKNGTIKIHYGDLWGKRQNTKSNAGKYSWLSEHDLKNTEWVELYPQAPFYLFVPYDTDVADEYEKGTKINKIFNITSTGVKTHRDHFAIDFDRKPLEQRVSQFRDLSLPDEIIRETYKLKDTRDWKLHESRISLSNNQEWDKFFFSCLYRPFDSRKIFNHSNIVELSRTDVMQHMILGDNLGLVATRLVTSLDFCHVLCTRDLIEMKTCSHDRGTNLFPLYCYPTQETKKQATIFDVSAWPADEENGGRVPNLAPAFVAEMEKKLGLTFQPFQISDFSEKSDVSLADTFTPEDIFHYIYAIFHSPSYRSRYAEFLKIDFPRVPLTANAVLFRDLCALGAELVGLHLLEAPAVSQFITRFPVAGDNSVAKGYPKYVPPKEEEAGRIYINKTQYVAGVSPALWEFRIGGYQVLQKWLKDRRGRTLSYDDLTHYQQMVVALQQTMALMEQIDDAIGEWPIE